MASKKTASKGVVKSTKRPTPPALQSDMIRHGTKRNSFIKTKYMNLENIYVTPLEHILLLLVM